MCGIFGFAGRRERAQSIDLNVALKSLHHRGPDDRGTFFSQSKRDPRLACAFAHTRLAIIDLTAGGHQPMTTEDGRFTVVYNGEVFNFREIRAELELFGERFRSQSDTEVILRAYARWGRKCAQRFRGMFAFAIWDSVEGILALCRDRFGIKPLYIAEGKDGVAFSSEIRTLLSTKTASRKLSWPGLLSYLTFGSVSDPLTILDGVVSVMPGTWVEYRDGRLSAARYWQLPADLDEAMSFEEAVETVSPLLTDAVRLHLVSDVAYGVFLSGGIDSSSVVALASRISSQPIHSFTVTFDEAEFDEGADAAKVAAIFQCEHHQVHVPARAILENVDRVLQSMDQPSVDGANTYFVAKATREAGLAVALSGLGGDEIFGGYGHFHQIGNYLTVSRMGDYIPDWLRGLTGAERSGAGSAKRRKLSALLDARGSQGAVYGVLRSLFLPAQQAALLGAALKPTTGSSSTQVENRRRTGDIVNDLSRLELTNYLRNTLLRDTDAMSMAHSLEIRVPLLDHPLVEAILRISGELKVRGPGNKRLLTASVPGLPAALSRKPKMGFTLPWDRWLRGPLRERVESILAQRIPALELAAVQDVWKRFLDGRSGVTFSRVWALVALIEWCCLNEVEEVEPESVYRRSRRTPSVREAAVASGDGRAIDPSKSRQGRTALFLFPEVFSSYGGIQQASKQLLRATRHVLPELSADVLSLNDDTDDAADFWEWGDRWRIHCFAKAKVQFSARCIELARRQRPDFVVLGHLNLVHLAPLIRTVSSATRVIVILHGIESWVRRNLLIRSELPCVETFACPSTYTMKRFRESNYPIGRGLQLLPWFVEASEERFPPPYPYPDPGFILSVTRLAEGERYKGLATLFDSIAILQSTGNFARCVIVGDGPSRLAYEQLARRKGIADRVQFLGSVEDAVLDELYRRASVFVLPSTKEGFGIVYLEAMSRGKAVIATTIGGQTDIISDSVDGFLIEPGDAEMLAARLAVLTVNDTIRMRMGNAAQEKTRTDYSFSKFCTDWTSILLNGVGRSADAVSTSK
jgi:asparagine synthase (glutamine-hydrolysing)